MVFAKIIVRSPINLQVRGIVIDNPVVGHLKQVRQFDCFGSFLEHSHVTRIRQKGNAIHAADDLAQYLLGILHTGKGALLAGETKFTTGMSMPEATVSEHHSSVIGQNQI